MTSETLEAYLSGLERELRKNGLVSARIIEEVREHLVDAIEDGLQRGVSLQNAEREALMKFGAPETVAAHFATEKNRMGNRLLFMLARIARLIRRKEPDADDNYDMATISGLMPSKAAHFHDVTTPSRHHFELKRRYRHRFKRMSSGEQKGFIGGMKEPGEDVGAFETDLREHLVRFLGWFGPRTLGPNGTLESLTLLEDTTDSNKRGGRYLAAFGSGAKMIWTVQASEGAISLDGTSVPTA